MPRRATRGARKRPGGRFYARSDALGKRLRRGWPVGEARVVAGGGLKPFEIAATTTRATGEFELAVPLDARPVTPRQIRLQVHEGGQRLLETAELPLRAPQPGGLELRLGAC